MTALKKAMAFGSEPSALPEAEITRPGSRAQDTSMYYFNKRMQDLFLLFGMQSLQSTCFLFDSLGVGGFWHFNSK